jgi:hypothetical protein
MELRKINFRKETVYTPLYTIEKYLVYIRGAAGNAWLTLLSGIWR